MSSSLFDRARASKELGNPFVLYRKPGESVLKLIVQKGSVLHKVTDFSDRGFVFAPFQTTQPVLLLKPDETYEEEYVQPYRTHSSKPADLLSSESEKEAYLDMVSGALEVIDTSALRKVVVSRSSKFSTDIPPMRIFMNLLDAQPEAFCYHWYHPQTGHWLGASPELFLSTRNKRLKTFSLAGTHAFVKDSTPGWKEKEIEEQEIVTQYIADSLQSLSIEPQVSAVETVRAGNLWHLKTEITGNIGLTSLQSVIAALHPTPAVCGYPRELAMQFITENEGYDRSFYTGFLGECNMKDPGNCDLYVNLRCMSWNDGLAAVFIGGGITASSSPLAEWEETVQKSKTILNSVFK